MNAKVPTPDATTALLALTKATADAHRLDILRVLSRESFGVLELCAIIDVPQSGMSHHLKVLATAGLVESRRQGNSIFYRRAVLPAQHPFSAVTSELFAAIDRLALPAETLARCEAVHAERGQQASAFFSRNADKLRDNQDLIAGFEHYGDCLVELLNRQLLDRRSTVIEVGPGDSELLTHLSQAYASVLAVDNTQAMLDKSRKRAGRRQNIRFHLGELADVATGADLIVLNMVLHHLPSPARLFDEANDHLNPGGMLLVADLSAHDQDWVRDVCGDQWLGFDPKELDQWANAAGLTTGQDTYVGLRNGFQVQIRLFHKPLPAEESAAKS